MSRHARGSGIRTLDERVPSERQGFELRAPEGEHVDVVPVSQAVEGEREVGQIANGGGLRSLSTGRPDRRRYARYVV